MDGMFRVDPAPFVANIRDIHSNQVPFATALALTWTAQDIKKAERQEMEDIFDNPTSFTLNSLYVTRATKQRQFARVWFKDYVPKGTPSAEYLQAQVKGGDRRQKRYEVALAARGVIGAGRVTAPGAGARLNRAGNISQGQINRMLNSLHAQRTDTTQHTVKRGNRHFFVHRDSAGDVDTIYVRQGRKVKPFLHVFDAANYERRFRFYEIAEKVRDERFKHNFKRAWKRAMATRR